MIDGTELKQILDAHQKSVLDVSYETKLALQTVYNFMNGERVARRTRITLEEYARQLKASRAGGKTAAG